MEKIILPEEQYQKFLEELKNPKPPTQALLDLVKNYNNRVKSGQIKVK